MGTRLKRIENGEFDPPRAHVPASAAEVERDEFLFGDGGNRLATHDAVESAPASEEQSEQQRGRHENDNEDSNADQEAIKLRAFGDVAFGMVDGDEVVEVNGTEELLHFLRWEVAADDGDQGA